MSEPIATHVFEPPGKPVPATYYSRAIQKETPQYFIVQREMAAAEMAREKQVRETRKLK
jgi:hypothetical protein